MPGKRQPTDVVVANGRKHLSRSEEAERRAGEVRVKPPKTAKAPKWLPEGLRKDFRALGKRLIATQETEAALRKRDSEAAEDWGRIQERYFKQARNCANDMGLTVTSRCRLVVPTAPEQRPEDVNPFLSVIRCGEVRNA